MLPEAHPLIEAATKPIADNAEQRLALNALLGENLVPDHPTAAETLARFGWADGKKSPQRWMVCLHVGAVVASLLLAIPAFKLWDDILASGLSGRRYGKLLSKFPENLTPSQQLLLGDPVLPPLRRKATPFSPAQSGSPVYYPPWMKKQIPNIALVPLEVFQQYFGPGLLGLLLTLVATTVIEVCSEGSSPIGADLLTRANAPGNAFVFLMAGAATDYTEILSLKETTHSWRATLALPLLSTPQVLLIGWLIQCGG